jgi:hypothetical protein
LINGDEMRILKLMIKQIANEDSGQVLILVLVVLLIGALLMGALMGLLGTGIKTATVYENRSNTLYAADAGVQDAISQIMNQTGNNKVPTTVGQYGSAPTGYYYLNTTENGTAVQVKVQIRLCNSTPTYQILATALGNGNSSTTVTSYVAGSSTNTPLFGNAICSLGGDISLSGGTVVSPSGSGGANVFAVGNVNLSGSASITGNVYATGNVGVSPGTINGNASASGTITSSGTVTGTKTSGSVPQSPPSYSVSSTVQSVYNETYTNVASINNPSPTGVTTYSSGLTINNNKINGTTFSNGEITNPIYVNGDLNLGGSNTIPVVFDSQVYVTGNINVSGGNQTFTFSGPVYAGGYLNSGGGTFNITFNNILTLGSTLGSATSYINLGGNGSFAFNGALKDMGNFSSSASANTSFSSTIYVGGNLAYSGSSTGLNINNDVYINGSLTTSGSGGEIIGPENVVVRGSGASTAFSVSGGSQLGTNQLPFIIVPPAATVPAISPPDPSSVQISGSGAVSALIYAPTSTFNNSGGASLFGAVVCKNSTLSGSAVITYPSGLTTSRAGLPSSGGITVLTYNIGNIPSPPTGSAAKLAFTTQPSNGTINAAFGTQPAVAVEDSNGNVITTDNATQITLTITSNTGTTGAVLAGTKTVTVVSGVATFSGLNINLIGTNYTLTATSSPAYTSSVSNGFNITTGAATKLVFTVQPSNGTAGSTMSPSTVVAVEDSNGNLVTTDNATQITLAITAGSGTNGAVLSGIKTVAVVSGVATFSGLSINLAGTNYTLTATSSPSYTAAICGGFNLSGAASKLAFTAQISNGMAGTVLLTSPVVAVEDVNGNIVASDNTTQITLAITSNTGTNGAILSGVKTVTVTSGVATFNGLSISLAGNAYTLTATSNPSYTLATSSSFNLSEAASQLVFTASPSNGTVGSSFSSQPVVQVEDIFGNVVTTDNTTQVTLAVTLGTGTYGAVLSGTTTVTVASGVATFSGLAINLAGTNYTLTATSNPSYVSAISNSFSLNNGNHTFNVTSNTNWSAIKDGIYGPPAAGDTVIVSNGATVNVDMSNAMVATLQLGGTASKSGDGTLTFSSSSTNLTVSSSLIFGNIANGANKTQGNINMSSGATLQINGSIVVNTAGTWTPGIGTVIYGASGAQTIDTAFFTSYYNLTLSGSGLKTTTGVVINGILTMSGTATASAALTYGSTPTLIYAGSSAQTTGPELPTTFSGEITINNANGVNLNSSPTLSGTLTLNYGTFAVGSNTLTLNGPAIAGTPANLSTSSSSSLVFGGSSTGIAIPSSITALKNLTISNSNGVAAGASFTVAGTLTISSGATLSMGTYTLSSVATVSNSGTIETQNTSSTPLPAGLTWGGTVLYDATAGQTVVAGTYNNLTLSGSGVETLPVALTSVGGNLTLSDGVTATTGAALTISGNLNIGDGTTFTAAGYALTVTGTTTVGGGTSGTLNISSATGTKAFNGDIVVANGATWNNTAANVSLALPGNLTNNGTFNAGNGVYTFSGSSKTITGTLSIPSVTISGTYLNNGTLTVGIALAGTGTLTNGTTGTLNIGGSSGITTLTATAAGNTVNYTGTSQTLKVTSYSNLTLSGGAETFGAITTIGGNLTLSGTATATTGANLAISGALNIGNGTTLTVGGYTLTVSGTTTVGNGGTGGNIIFSSATNPSKTFTGLVTINANSSWTENAAITPTFSNGISNGGSFTASTGVHTFSTNAQSLTGTWSIPSVTVTGVTLTNNGTLTVATALAGTGSLTNAATGTLNIGGTCSVTTLANAGTVAISGSGAISTALANFTNTGTLNLNGTGTITGITNNSGGIINLASSGTITALTNATSTSTLNISAATVPTITTLTATAAGNTVNYTGAAQTVKATTYYNLIFSGNGVKSMATGTSVTNNLSIAPPASSATASVGAGLTLTVNTLTLGGTLQTGGPSITWGGTGSGATNIVPAYFAATTGKLQVNH